jgi:hypothetical protein
MAWQEMKRDRDSKVRPLDRWLRQDVVPVYEAMQKNPRRAIPAKRVFADIRARHAERVKKLVR